MFKKLSHSSPFQIIWQHDEQISDFIDLRINKEEWLSEDKAFIVNNSLVIKGNRRINQNKLQCVIDSDPTVRTQALLHIKC